MKRILSASLLLAASFAACKKEPPVGNLSNDFVVVTNYDTLVNFGDYKTFEIRDSIAVRTGDPRDSVWSDANADSIIKECAGQMEAAGYTRVWPGSDTAADLGIQLSAIRNTYTYIDPGYWNTFPGYAGPGYWGDRYGYPYDYPYWYSYSVNTGSLTMQMIDLKYISENNALDVVWTGSGFGQIGNSDAFIVHQCLRSVDQAFAQSPYLKAN